MILISIEHRSRCEELEHVCPRESFASKTLGSWTAVVGHPTAWPRLQRVQLPFLCAAASSLVALLSNAAARQVSTITLSSTGRLTRNGVQFALSHRARKCRPAVPVCLLNSILQSFICYPAIIPLCKQCRPSDTAARKYRL
ncbi:hypothetical protein D918_08954 [Trichuris suis]|nr:hypothetical protein D918_08954 [Trichuris suis]